MTELAFIGSFQIILMLSFLVIPAIILCIQLLKTKKGKIV